jgi:two-component system, OmpR family, response regulator MprA
VYTPPPGKVRVLIIDDDQGIRDSLSFLLEDGGYIVYEAPDGLIGMDMLLISEYPLIVLLDLMMPRMSGFEILRFLAHDAGRAARHAYILLTANDTALGRDDRLLLARLRVPVIPKPFDMDALLDAVAQAVSRITLPTTGPLPPADSRPSAPHI